MLSPRMSRIYWSGRLLCRQFSHHEQPIRILCRTNLFRSSLMYRILSKYSTTPSLSYSVTKQQRSEELLEKLIADISTDIHQKNRVYKNFLAKVINKVNQMNFSTKRQGLLLLRCCTELLPDEAPETRLKLADEIWNVLSTHTKFEREHYHELLKVYLANNKTVKVNTFIQNMSPITPNITTYELLLRNLGEQGDLNQITEALANMKAQGLPASEHIFNSLIICQGRLGNLDNIEEILTMMRSLKLEPTINTYTAKVRALVFNKRYEDMSNVLNEVNDKGLKLSEGNVMDIVKTLALCGGESFVPKVLKHLPETTLSSPSISPLMQSVTTWLVFHNFPLVALDVYNCLPVPSFGPKDDKALHGRSLIRDCVKAAISSNVILRITDTLMSSGRNPLALHNACEAALQLGRVQLALDLLEKMREINVEIRPHYFWPLFVVNSKNFGQKGVIEIIKSMVSLKVSPDYETMMDYVLTFVSFNSPQDLAKRFLEVGLNVSTVLSPMMETLLSTGQVRAASELCELYQGKVQAEKLLPSLVKSYIQTHDAKHTVNILEDISTKASKKDKDWTGRFLCKLIRNRQEVDDVGGFVKVLAELQKRSMKISKSASELCISRIPQHWRENKKNQIQDMLNGMIDERLIDEIDTFTYQMQHPNSMDEESLSSHLRELEAKSMNTRGVLRKLLLEYCRSGRIDKAKEMVERCEREGVHISAGMKAAIFDLHVKSGNIEGAELTLIDIARTSPNFTIDEFKVLDLATLMVKNGKEQAAVDLIKNQSVKRRVIGGRKLETNCWRLLDAATNTSSEQVQELFKLLTSYGYCQPSNILLGPLVRVHLKSDNLNEAVKTFSSLAKKYRKTPLKHELLCMILTKVDDNVDYQSLLNGKGEYLEMVQSVLRECRQVHGAGDKEMSLISALADIGHVKTLRSVFLDPSVRFNPESLLLRCDRFAEEKKLNALKTIALAAKDFRKINSDKLYESMLKVYTQEDDYNGANGLWLEMQENDVIPTQNFITKLVSLLKANNKSIPSDLAVLLGKKGAVHT